jgi:serine/threonine protein kinase
MNFVQSTQEIRFGETLFVSQGVKNQVQVLKAFWKDLVVAVKIYRNARIEDHQQEINYLMKLSGIHSSFLDFYGYFRENECVYIVMEFCEMTLNDLVIKISEREIFLEDEKVFGIVDDLIHTFAVLESFKVYHRDIKSENIVVSKDFKVKIIDFNISESLEYLESKSEISLRSTIGTMGYMSPELKRFNNQGLTQACFNLALSDVYSLGIVLMIVFIKKNHSNQGLFQQEEFVKNRVLGC